MLPVISNLAIVSPHRDDAAFSCGIFMSRCMETGVAVTIVNIFTESDYAPYLSGRSSTEITQARLQEDESLLEMLGPLSRMQDLGLKDAPLRLGLPVERVMQQPLSAERFRHEVDQLSPELAFLRDFDLILLPLDIGGHVDHRIVRDAGRKALPADKICFYEDLPYAARVDESRRRACVGETDMANWKELERIVLRKKNGARCKAPMVSLYRSQISAAVADEMVSYSAALNDGERFYVPTSMAPNMIRLFTLHPTPGEVR